MRVCRQTEVLEPAAFSRGLLTDQVQEHLKREAEQQKVVPIRRQAGELGQYTDKLGVRKRDFYRTGF